MPDFIDPMTPLHTPTLADNLRWHELQINRLGVCPLGPIEVRDDEGSITFLDNGGNITFAAEPEGGAQVRYKGGPTSLTGVLESADRRITAEAETRLAQDNKVNGQAIGYANTAESNAKSYADSKVAAEAATRLAQDNKVNGQAQGFANTAEANAKAYAGGRVNSEAATRSATDASHSSRISSLESRTTNNDRDIGVMQSQIALILSKINAM